MAIPVTAERGIDLLLDAGLRVRVVGSTELAVSGFQVKMQVPGRTPSPSDVEKQLNALSLWATLDAPEDASRMLLVLAKVPASISRLAFANPRLAVVGVNESTVIWGGSEIVLERRGELAPRPAPPAARRQGRVPWKRHALFRVLLLSGKPRRQAELARLAHMTQAGVSTALSGWPDLIEKSETGWALSDPDRAWRLFMNGYPGPGGITEYWYRDDSVLQQARDAASQIPIAAPSAAATQVLGSGDVAADAFAPWRIARRAIVYAPTGLALERAGFADTAQEEATLEVVIPADPTIWLTATLWGSVAGNEGEAVYVDPVLAAWDVLRIGGPDAEEAAEKLRAHVTARLNK